MEQDDRQLLYILIVCDFIDLCLGSNLIKKTDIT